MLLRLGCCPPKLMLKKTRKAESSSIISIQPTFSKVKNDDKKIVQRINFLYVYTIIRHKKITL